MPPQNMLLSPIDYVELKTLEIQLMQEGISHLPLLPKSRLIIKFPMRKVSSLYQKENNIVITRDLELTLKWTCTNTPTKITLLFSVSFPHAFLVTVSPFTTSPAKPFVLSHPTICVSNECVCVCV